MIDDLFTKKGVKVSDMTFLAVGIAGAGEGQAYGFWITPKLDYDFAEIRREVMELFYSSGFKALSVTKKDGSIVVFAL